MISAAEMRALSNRIAKDSEECAQRLVMVEERIKEAAGSGRREVVLAVPENTVAYDFVCDELKDQGFRIVRKREVIGGVVQDPTDYICW